MGETKKQIPERLDAPQPSEPDSDPLDTPTWRAVKNGAKWGSIVGTAIAAMIMSANSIDTPFGPIYGGNALALFGVWIGLGTALGAGIGWLTTQDIDSGSDGPSPR